MKRLYAITILFLLTACKHTIERAEYRFINSQILVTSDTEDKIELLNNCKDARIYCSADSIEMDVECLFEKPVQSKITTIENVDSVYLARQYALLTSRIELPGNTTYKKMNVTFITGASEKDSLTLLCTKNKLLLLYEPYLLTFQKN
ncbi:hypothetical protein [Ferruginibacter sp.]